MKVLDFTKNGNDAYSVDDGLGALWDRAERLGDVELKMPGWPTSKRYEAEIKFKRKSGSYVFAKGQSDDRDAALKAAIDEAISLGAAT